MDKNKECYLIKDLAPAYIDNMVSIQSKDLIEKHLSDCKDCKEYYNNMNSNIFQEIDKEKTDDLYEFNHLKKIRNHMNYLKISILIIILVIIFFVVGIIVKCNYTNHVFEMSYNKIEELKKLDNYVLIQKTTYKDLKERSGFETTANYYCKDGKYKVVSTGNDIDINDDKHIDKLDTSITYMENDSLNKIVVFEDLKQIEYYYNQGFVEMKKGDVFEIFTDVINYKRNYTKFSMLGLSMKKKKINGITYYVIRKDMDNFYKEIWINKDTFTITKIVEESYNSYYREVNYEILVNTVTEDDVDASILKTDRYKDYKVDYIDNSTLNIWGIKEK